jgi:hypothetical protein
MSAATQNFTIASLLALGSSQTWSVASNRTLTVSGITSGATSSLTKSDDGTLALTTATNTFGSGGGQTFTAAGGLTTAALAGSLGSASNSIVVTAGGAIRFAAVPSQTSFSVAGSGNALQPAAVFFNSATAGFASGKTLTLSGNAPTIGLDPNAPHAGVINGSPTGDFTLLLSGTVGAAGATLSSTQNFSVASGSYLVLQGSDATGTPAIGEFSLTSTDAGPFGAASNAIKVRSTVALTNYVGSSGSTPVTLSRDYFFEGQSTSAAPSSPNTHSVKLYYPQGNGEFLFTGTIRGTAGYWVKTSFNGTQGAAGSQAIRFGGKLDGTWSLRSFASTQNIYLNVGLDISTWTGDLWANRVFYGVRPTGAATYDTTAVIDNITGSPLTLLHSGYTLAGDLTFAGSADMSLGSGNVSTAASPNFAVSASTLTIDGTITGSVAFTKSAIGGLTLNGATSGYSSYSHTGGTLTLNNNNVLGSGAAGLVITAVVANTLDSTTGATLVNFGATALNGNFTWGGSANLTLGPGNVTLNAARTITFVAGKNGILKAPGPINTVSAFALTIGGSPVGGSQSRFWLVGANPLISTTHSVTAGYFRISNSLGLGAVGYTATWTVSSGAALELADGITPTSNKTAAILGTGPNIDGALRSVNGNNTFSGPISISSAAVTTRFQVDAGTFTLSGAQIAPAAPNTPLAFTALGASAVLNQQRQLGANVGNVSTNNGGVGTVVLSTANLHSGALTCETGGTTRVTQANATGSGAGNDVFVVAGGTLESTVQSIFSAKLSLGTNGSGARAILKFAA